MQLEEICDNAVDDDGDGLIDLNDPDCVCPVIEPTSLIPNPSFEERSCCPNSRSQLHCADTWIQASEPTTDYIHTCGWMGWDEFPVPRPLPDGDGLVGFRDGRVLREGDPDLNWKEYAGACLLSPLRANTAYRFEFYVGFVNEERSPPINITFFGTSDCDNLPFGRGNEEFGCPTNGPGWVLLGSVRVKGPGWMKAWISVTPREDIAAIAIGPACPGVQSPVSLYYYFDNLVLADQQSFDFKIAQVEHPCSDQFTLEIPASTGLTYQWYRNGIALLGETSPRLSRIQGEGDYQVRILGDNECKVTQFYRHRVPVERKSVTVTICEDDFYRFGPNNLTQPGNYTHTFKTVNNCDSIVSLKLNVLGLQADTVSAAVFEGESYRVGNRPFSQAGEHQVALTSSQGCDSLVVLRLRHYQAFFPTAFSPNNDGINDYFNVFGNEDLQVIESLQIFDRWGNLVFEKRDLPPNGQDGWDGKHRGKPLNPGVYLYKAVLRMEDGGSRNFSGSVALLK